MAISCGYIVYLYHLGFQRFDHPETISDVIPQLEALWDRFAKGEQPYYPLHLPTHSPYPVYMPAHWLTIAVPKLFGFDLCWIGLMMLFATIFLLTYSFAKRSTNWPYLVLAVLTLPAVLFSFYKWGDGDLMITFETPVTAFYLILAWGLYKRNLIIVTAGIILCVLSRYTLIFWLPLFGLMLLYEKPLKQNLMVWGSVALSILLLYVIPFLLRQPDILAVGVKYHNDAAIGEWGSGRSFKLGTYFAPHFKALFSGTLE